MRKNHVLSRHCRLCFAAVMRASAYGIIFTYLLYIPAAHAQTLTYVKISSGTGFVINRGGDIVTNAHVLKDCRSIGVLGEGGETKAELIASDSERDLAVIRTPLSDRMMVAPLRFNIRDLAVGDTVVLPGFPGQAGAEGHASYKKTTVTALSGPQGEANWIQLASVAEQGNSGGPVLDTAGHVIAVIAGIAQTYRADASGRPTGPVVGQSDVAITLAALQDFLQYHRIPFYQSPTGDIGYADTILKSNAHKFIVPIRCNQGEITP